MTYDDAKQRWFLLSNDSVFERVWVTVRPFRPALTQTCQTERFDGLKHFNSTRRSSYQAVRHCYRGEAQAEMRTLAFKH